MKRHLPTRRMQRGGFPHGLGAGTNADSRAARTGRAATFTAPATALLVALGALACTGCNEGTAGRARTGRVHRDEADALLQAAVSAQGPERTRATDAVLDAAERLAEGGRPAEAERIYRTLWERSDGPDRRHVRCAAIRGLAHVLGPAAVDDLAAAIAEGDPQVRASAIAAAAESPGEDVTRAWIRRLGSADADVQPAILQILGRRGGPAATEAVLPALGSQRPEVRRAAIHAAVDLGSPRAVMPLVGLLSSEDETERAAAADALARLSAPEASAAVAGHLLAAAPASRQRLIGVLVARAACDQAPAIAACLDDESAGVQAAASRALAVLGGEGQVAALLAVLVRTEDEGVRGQAERALECIGRRSEAERFAGRIIDALREAGAGARAALVRLLADAPTPGGLAALRSALEDGDAGVRESAIRALGDWPSAGVADDLMRVAREGRTAKERILAVRGAIQQAGRSDRPPAEAVALYRQALNAAERPEERRLVLAGLAEVPALEALAMALATMKGGVLREEAAAAVISVAERVAGDHPVDAATALEAVLEVVTSGRLRERAERLREQLRRRRRADD